MSNSISDFKNAFNGGTRANRFQVSATWPTGVSVDNDDTTFKVFSANLPKSEVGTINVPYRGRLLNFAGDRVYGSWTLGVYDDGNAQNLWRAFNKWKDLLDSHDKHLVDSSDFDYSGLQKTWTLNQLNLNGANLRVIQLINCWPSQISNLDLDMAKADQSVFSVVMTFDYYNIQTGL